MSCRHPLCLTDICDVSPFISTFFTPDGGQLRPHATRPAKPSRCNPEGRMVLYNRSDRSLAIWDDKNISRQYFLSSGKAFVSRDYFRLLGAPESRESLESERASYESTSQSFGSDDSLPADLLNTDYYRRFFVEEKKIGSGGFGAVYLCRHVINGVDLGHYAIKKVPVGDNKPWLLRVLREVRALETLKKHPNIVNYSHSWLEYDQVADFGPKVPCMFILMEYANGGNLADLIWGSDAEISEMKIWECESKRGNFLLILADLTEITKGLDYLHRCGIIHRDIKPQNILISRTKDGGQRLLISDFGTCVDIRTRMMHKRTGNTGTLEYVAPECLQVAADGTYSMDFDYKCDIWSLGMIVHAMAFKRLPFKNTEDSEALTQEILHFTKVTFPPDRHRSSSLLAIISALLRRKPEERPTTAEILSSDFIKNLANQKEQISKGKIMENTLVPVAPRYDAGGLQRRIRPAESADTIQIPARKRSAEQILRLKGPKSDWSWYIAAHVVCFFLRVALSLNWCLDHNRVWEAHLYPSVGLSIVLLLFAQKRHHHHYTRHQYAVAFLQWLWTASFALAARCGQASAITSHLLVWDSLITLLTIAIIYISQRKWK